MPASNVVCVFSFNPEPTATGYSAIALLRETANCRVLLLLLQSKDY